ncbi:hypothetical protein HAX54_006993 [Datura stramonium]|uniref:Uncharacterized protein n=1 Tax=Datura stramonium TaxID=4076 RepID=A0ABS8WUG6_DATST|nr:hypothetical protein [Datura stramonium]
MTGHHSLDGVTAEVTTRHTSGGGVNYRLSDDGPSPVPSRSVSSILWAIKNDGGSMDRQVSDGLSRWSYLERDFHALIFKGNDRDDGPSEWQRPVTRPSNAQ